MAPGINLHGTDFAPSPTIGFDSDVICLAKRASQMIPYCIVALVSLYRSGVEDSRNTNGDSGKKLSD